MGSLDGKIFKVDLLQGCSNLCFFLVVSFCFVLGYGVMILHVVISLCLVKNAVLLPLLSLRQKASLFTVGHEVLSIVGM